MKCHYCEKTFPDSTPAHNCCDHCGMPLPLAQGQRKRRQHFKLWVLIIGIFCALMIIWLPRHISR